MDLLCASLLEDHEALAVFAAAGSGKTVEAQLFARRYDWPLAWLTLDGGDRSPARLLGYLAAALAPHTDRPLRIPEELGRSETTAAAIELAESVGSRRVLIVFDQCEAISDAADVCALIEAFLDYLPFHARTLLLSRSELHISLGRLLLHGRAARLTDEDLALTFDEAVTLARAVGGHSPDDVRRQWEAGRGWVAGVAFGRPGQAGLDPSRDFRSYLRHEVFEPLSLSERQFLMDTSILDSVSLRSATVLCGPESQQVWHKIEMRHLPATTSADRTIVYHPCLREFLREELEATDPDRFQRLERRHADLLLAQNRYEDAVELLLELGAEDDAASAAEKAIPELVGRGDWDVMLRWIERLGQERVNLSARLLGAEIAALRGARRISECREKVRQLQSERRLAEVIDADPRILIHAAWAMLWRPDEGLALLDRYDGQRRAGGIRYLLEVLSGTSPVLPPRGQPWNENDRLVSWGLMVQGRIDDLVGMLPPADQWPPRSPFTTPHPLLGLVWQGELARARHLFEQVPLDEKARIHTDMWHYLESWLLLAEGDLAGAAVASEQAVTYSRVTGFSFEPVFQIAEAQALMGLGRLDEAVSLLYDSLDICRRASVTAYVEWGQGFLGKAELLRGHNETAVALLRESVTGMDRASRLFMLPLAAVFLAEAEARIGEDERAADAATLAYEAAERMGTFFPLQLALRDFPAVLDRQREVTSAQHWRHLSAPRAVPATPRVASGSTESVVVLQPFGQDPHLLIDGRRSPIRRLKVLELVAFLAAAGDKGVERDIVNLRLFPDSDRRRGSNHFRQIVHQLRKTTGLSLERSSDGSLHWDRAVSLVSADVELEHAVAEARGLAGARKLERLVSVLDPVRGEYLAASDLEWATARRFSLEVLVEEAETEVAQLALGLHEYDTARSFAERALQRDPYAEDAYWALIEVELAIGSKAAAMAVYRRYVASLAELGLRPNDRISELIRHS